MMQGSNGLEKQNGTGSQPNDVSNLRPSKKYPKLKSGFFMAICIAFFPFFLNFAYFFGYFCPEENQRYKNLGSGKSSTPRKVLPREKVYPGKSLPRKKSTILVQSL